MSRLVNEKGEPYVDDALERFTPTDYYRGYKEGYEGGYQRAREVFEPKRGRWIIKGIRWLDCVSLWWHDTYECSVCGSTGLEKWNYCPKCGAYMRESTMGQVKPQEGVNEK